VTVYNFLIRQHETAKVKVHELKVVQTTKIPQESSSEYQNAQCWDFMYSRHSATLQMCFQLHLFVT